MTGESGRLLVLRLAERMLERACRRLPEPVRDERVREWCGELPVILADPDARFAWVRCAKALRFAAGAARVARGMGRARSAQQDQASAIAARTALRIMAIFILGRAPARAASLGVLFPRFGVLGKVRLVVVVVLLAGTQAIKRLPARARREALMAVAQFEAWAITCAAFERAIDRDRAAEHGHEGVGCDRVAE